MPRVRLETDRTDETQEELNFPKTGTKSNPGPHDCYAAAGPDEQIFHLLGRDRHASALVELWALLREKEGEDPAVVQEARDRASAMAAEARSLGKPVLELNSLLSFAASVKEGKAAQDEQDTDQNTNEATSVDIANRYGLKVGEIVVAGRGTPMKLDRVFGDTDADGKPTDERVRGKANVKTAKGQLLTVDFDNLRRAQPEEVDAFRQSGGRL
jgi:hypothetical protein